jgi:hypothetical protein
VPAPESSPEVTVNVAGAMRFSSNSIPGHARRGKQRGAFRMRVS